jgi:hypothetical protein
LISLELSEKKATSLPAIKKLKKVSEMIVIIKIVALVVFNANKKSRGNFIPNPAR